MRNIMVLVMTLVVSFQVLAYNDPRNSDNPLIRHGLLNLENEELSLPKEVDVSEREIARFAVAVVDIAVLKNRISARMALGEEDDKELIYEWAEGLTRILLEAELTIERYLVLDAVVQMVPVIGDDMRHHARLERSKEISLMEPVSSFRDFKTLLEGHVDYPVNRELYNRASKRLTQSLPSKSEGGLPSITDMAR